MDAIRKIKKRQEEIGVAHTRHQFQNIQPQQETSTMDHKAKNEKAQQIIHFKNEKSF